MNSNSRKMESNLTGMWVSFFTAAGIPSEVSATYALTFTENRIQEDMLLDLNKEYLRDMGISRMGDVIAILRHAKQVHENTARDRVLSTATTSAKVPIATVAGRFSSTNTAAAPNKPSSPVSRILEHYTRKALSGPESPSPVAVNTVSIVQLKRKSNDTGEDANNIKRTRTIRVGAPQPVVKESVASPSKLTVFARLGSNEPKKTITISSPINLSTQTNSVGKPVFSRLGAKSDAPNVPEKTIPIQKDALKYEGILKAIPKTAMTVTATKTNRTIAVGTMRADETPLSVRQKLALPVTSKRVEEQVTTKSKSVKFSNTIRYKEIESVKPVSQIFNKPERRLSMPQAQEGTGVKARLGIKTNSVKLV